MQPCAIPSALLIIDMQVGLFSGLEQPYQAARLLDNVNRLIHKARATGAPIFAVRHTGPQGSPIETGSPLWQCHPGLNLDAAVDTLFDKTRPSCFNGTTLAEQLTKAAFRN